MAQRLGLRPPSGVFITPRPLRWLAGPNAALQPATRSRSCQGLLLGLALALDSEPGVGCGGRTRLRVATDRPASGFSAKGFCPARKYGVQVRWSVKAGGRPDAEELVGRRVGVGALPDGVPVKQVR